MTTRFIARALAGALFACAGLASVASAQDGTETPGEAVPPPSGDAEPEQPEAPPPPPDLEQESLLEAQVEEELEREREEEGGDETEERQALPILPSVGGRPPRAAEHDPAANRPQQGSGRLPNDTPFLIPGDLRNQQNIGSPLPGQEPESAPPYLLAVSGGVTHWLAPGTATGLNFARIEERFEARLPELGGFLFGAGAAQIFNFNSQIAMEVGPRVGWGAYFCDERDVKCEGAVHIQPGIAFGFLGVQFDLHADLDVRLLLWRVLQVGITGGYSFIGGGNFLNLTGMVGVMF